MERFCMGCMKTYDDQLTVCPHCGYEYGTPPAEAFHITPGTVLEDRYIIGRALGFGGFGVTYLGYDRILQKRIAVKEYLPGEFSTRMPKQNTLTIYSGDKEEQFLQGKEKFIDEAKRLAKFQNVPEIIHIYDCFEANETAYIVMEYVDGESLKQKLERDGKMTVEQAFPIILDVLHGLEAVHKGGILHRDIAPDNIYITKDGRVKILDFGAARYATTTHSRSLTVLIKPGYAPEEQYRSRGDQGTWTDVYAVAATFYRMITGIVPEDALERAAKDHVKEPSKLGVKIGPNTEAALMNALNIKVEGRTPTAEAFEQELMAQVVKRVIVKKQQIDIGKWPLWVKVLAGIAAVGIGGFAVLMGTGVIQFNIATWNQASVPQGKTRVPNVINEEMETAVERGEKAQLSVQVYDKQYSNEIPENRVLSQTLKSGSMADINEVLGIVISAGIEKTYVPNVVGMDSEEAVQKLKDAGLVVSTKEEEYRAAPGTIGWQSLEENLETETGTAIEVLISKGLSGGDSSKAEIVDDMTGMSYDAAADLMAGKYLYLVRMAEEYSDTVPAGSIIRQEPAAGSTLNQNSNIQVVVSLGREMVNVPDVQFKTQEEAVSILEAAGLSAEIHQEANANVAAGNVIRQEIEAGTRMEKGTVIMIYISTGAPQTRQPQTQAPRQTAPPQTQAAPPPTTAAPPPTTAAPPPQTTAPPETTSSGRNPVFDLLQ